MKEKRADRFVLVLRIVVAVLIAAHGWARWLAGGVEPFGAWLGQRGFPLGGAIAWTVTVLEVLGTPLLAFGRLVSPLCAAYAAIYLMGIVLVHAPEGWFVVGLGRNGMEYSALLVVCLLGLAYTHGLAVPDRSPRASSDRAEPRDPSPDR